MSKKVGRPKVPKSEAKAVLYGARVTPEEASQITKKLSESGQTASKVIRRAFDDFVTSIWTTPKWSYEDLNGKTVEFKFAFTEAGKGWDTSGHGNFFVMRNAYSQAKLALEIEIKLREGRGIRLIRLPLNQYLVDLIERHPDPAVADFRCIEKK